MRREAIGSIIDALRAGQAPAVAIEDFPCFSREATQGNPHVDESTLATLIASWGAAEIPVFERALRAIDQGELAWLGFKIVYDGSAAQSNTDNEVTKKYGAVGSADGLSTVFFCSDDKELVAPRAFSDRDAFQMKDVTRGPSMHTDQFDGVTWCSVPLFDDVRVWIVGASDAASETAALATHVGFDVSVIDVDSAYLNEERFPCAHRILLDDFDKLGSVHARPGDYVCVLTRGHMADPEGCLWAVSHKAHYIGMMGCAGKNKTVRDLVMARGMSAADWDRIKRPIGLKFGAQTPAELAIAIVAELVDVRYRQRYSASARDKHDESLGRA